MKNIEGYTAGENTTAQKNISASDLIHFYGNWVWRAVEALVQARDFNPSPSWIADRLNISAEAATDALEGLLRIGVIKKTGEIYRTSTQFQYIGDTALDRSDLFQIHSKVKDQISSKLKSRDCFSNAILLSSRANVAEFYKKFCVLVEELNSNANIEDDATDVGVYGLELSLSHLSRENT